MSTVLKFGVREVSVGWFTLTCSQAFHDFVARMLVLPGVDTLLTGGVYEVRMPRNALAIAREAWASVGSAAMFTLDDEYRDVAASLDAALPRGVELEVPTGLYPHQEEAVLWLCRQMGGFLADDMGLGKSRAAATAVALYVKTYQHSQSQLKLIVGPSSVESVWRRELAALGLIDLPRDMAAARGVLPYEKHLAGILSSGWLFIPYHLVSEWVSFCRSNSFGRVGAVILDEAHWAKNPKSLRGQAAQTVSALANFRVILTGTPIPNRTAELWNLLSALDGTRSWGSLHDFRVRYCGAVHMGHGYVDTEPTHTDELTARMGARYLRRTAKSAGLQLPPFRREAYMVEPSPEETARYEILLKKYDGKRLASLVHMARTGVFSNETVRVFTKLRQFTSRVKRAATCELIRECRAQDQSVLVFCWEKDTANTIAAAVAADGPVYVITGDVPQEERVAHMEAFQRGGGVIVATLDTIREGVTLTKASRVIMHDQSWVPTDILQAEARINRIGQDKPVISTWMLMSGSFDTVLAAALTKKGADIARVLAIPEALEMADVFDGTGLEEATVDALRMLEQWATPLLAEPALTKRPYTKNPDQDRWYKPGPKALKREEKP